VFFCVTVIYDVLFQLQKQMSQEDVIVAL